MVFAALIVPELRSDELIWPNSPMPAFSSGSWE